MKLEYIVNINENGDSIVRLYAFDYIQADTLRQAISKTVIENKAQLDLATLDFIEPINCNLLFCIADTDVGIVAKDKQTFNCLLTLTGYQIIIQLLEPFCSSQDTGYQWLYDNNNPIDLLFSETGSW